MYALKVKGRFEFVCTARTQKEHEEKVQQAYWRWRGMLPRGTSSTIDVFLAGYEQVKVTLEPYNDEHQRARSGPLHGPVGPQGD